MSNKIKGILLMLIMMSSLLALAYFAEGQTLALTETLLICLCITALATWIVIKAIRLYFKPNN